jgi:hypothetical protein
MIRNEQKQSCYLSLAIPCSFSYPILNISVPPKIPPHISGIEDYYRIGDLVSISLTIFIAFKKLHHLTIYKKSYLLKQSSFFFDGSKNVKSNLGRDQLYFVGIEASCSNYLDGQWKKGLI